MNIDKAYTLLDTFFATGRELRFKRKEIIVQIGQKPESLYWLKSGTVKAFTYSEAGNEQVHHLFKEQEIFPFSFVINRKSTDVGFAAFTEATVLVKTIDETMEFLEKEPAAMAALLQQQSGIYDRLVNLNIIPSEPRVAQSIKNLADRFGEKEGSHITIRLPLTIQELSQNVRLSRESTGKILKSFEDAGAIVMSRRSLVVFPDKLAPFYQHTS